MKYKKLITLASASLVAAFVLAACGGGADETTAPAADGGTTAAQTTTTPAMTVAEPDQDAVLNDPFAALDAMAQQFGTRVVNDNPIIPGGELRWALGSTATIPGIWCGVHWISSLDADVRSFAFESLLWTDWDLTVSNRGTPARAHLDREARTVTVELIVDNWYWHDGVQVTLDDLLFAYEIIAHPDYTGPRWGPNISNVVGANEYRAGEADHISGLVLSEDRMTLTKHLISVTPQTMAFSFWSTPIPRHQWEPVLASGEVSVADMGAHRFARRDVLGNGAFIIDSDVPGESVRFVANENYWRGRPHLDAIRFEIVDPMMLPMAMQSGMYDVGSPFPQSQFTADFRYMTNVQWLSNPFTANSNSWMSFRMGTWDAEANEVYTFDDPRFSRTLRTAIMLTMDHFGAGALFNNLVVPNGSVYFGLRRMEWIDRSLPTFNHFDPELAAEMLDEAGYIDADGDGFRDFPDGSPLVITILMQTGSAANELNRQLELQNWGDLGLNVQMYQGRLVESAVGSTVRADESDGGVVDMFTNSWGMGANPNPMGIFGPQTRNNFPRYRSAVMDDLFERFQSDEMWDENFLLDTVNQWQHAWVDASHSFTTTTAIGLTAVNNRVANVSLEVTGDPSVVSSGANWFWALTAAEPFVDGE